MFTSRRHRFRSGPASGVRRSSICTAFAWPGWRIIRCSRMSLPGMDWRSSLRIPGQAGGPIGSRPASIRRSRRCGICSTASLPYAAERWGIRPPQIGLLGTSMGGPGRAAAGVQECRQVSRRRGHLAGHRLSNPVARGRRSVAGNLRRCRDGASRHRHAARSSAALAAAYLVLLRPGRRALARQRRPSADEARGISASRTKSIYQPAPAATAGNIISTWPREPSHFSPSGSSASGGESSRGEGEW